MRKLTTDDEYRKILITGKSGTGKSSLAATAEKPLVVLSEFQGYAAILDSAKRRGVEAPPTVFVESYQDYVAVLNAMREAATSGKFVIPGVVQLDYKPETVIIDSLTDAANVLTAEVFKDAPVGKDGFSAPSIRARSEVKLRIHRMVKAFRDLPCHLVCLCLLDILEIGEDGKVERVEYQPSVGSRKVGSEVLAHFNAAGMTFKQDGEGGKTEYRATFSGKPNMPVKANEHLAGVVDQDISLWIRKLEGEKV